MEPLRRAEAKRDATVRRGEETVGRERMHLNMLTE